MDLAVWSEGGLSYSELKNMPVDELTFIFEACKKIEQERKAAAEKMRAKK